MSDEIKFSIPEPCTESWDKMDPAEQGKFCDKCCKVVVDFTSKTTKEILGFISIQRNKSVCAKATAVQLSLVPVRTGNSKRKSLFFAAIYFVFGSFLFTACHSHKHSGKQVMGKFLVEPKHPAKQVVNPVFVPERK